MARVSDNINMLMTAIDHEIEVLLAKRAASESAPVKTLSVNFAFSDQPRISVVVRPDQTVADAIAPYIPEGAGAIRVLDFAGNDVTNLTGAQVQNDLGVMVSQMGVVRGGPSRVGPPLSEPASSGADLTTLNARTQRLLTLRDWLTSDPELARFVDDVIGKQVRAGEARQRRANIVLNVIFLAAGWLLSTLVTPAIFQHLWQIISRR